MTENTNNLFWEKIRFILTQHREVMRVTPNNWEIRQEMRET